MNDVANYAPPEVSHGDPVLYYVDASRSQRPYVGWVVNVDGRAIDIVTLSVQGMQHWQEVRHMTDPVLKENHNLRRNGGWDFHRKMSDASQVHTVITAFEDRMTTTTNALERRLASLEESLGVRHDVARAEGLVAPEAKQEPAPTPADTGLSEVTFSEPSPGVIEGGKVVKPKK